MVNRLDACFCQSTLTLLQRVCYNFCSPTIPRDYQKENRKHKSVLHIYTISTMWSLFCFAKQ